MNKTSRTKTATATATTTKSSVTINQLFALVATLVALGTKSWGKKTGLRMEDINVGKGYFQDANSGAYVQFTSYADGRTKLNAEIKEQEDAALAERLRKATLTRISGVAGYTAEVSASGIKIGCQNVPLAKFAELAKAVDKANKAIAEAKAKDAAKAAATK